MKVPLLLRWLAFLCILFASPFANAAITCTSLTATPVSINYVSNTTVSLQTNFTMAYTSFSAAAVSGTTNFRTTCKTGMPYTLDVAPASGTLAGVAYNMSLSATTPSGTGAPETFTVTATAPSGQSGTCTGVACTQSLVHTLTIGY